MSNNFEDAIRGAYILASDRRHELVTLEHLLASLLDSEEIVNIITELGVDVSKIKVDVMTFLDEPKNHVIIQLPGDYNPRHTALLLTMVKKAKTQNLFSGRNDQFMDLFLSLFNVEHSHASYFLFKAGLDKDQVIQYINKSNTKSGQDTMSEKDALGILKTYCVNLNEKAKEGKIDPLIGREEEVETITQITARRNKHNVIMIGDPGVGKTQVAEGIAKRIVDGQVPEVLANKTIWSLDISSIVAGTRFRGDFEERMKQVISALSASPNTIVFIDEIHMLMGAGSGGQGAMDAANLLKPALSRGDIRCIGSTTLEEYRKHFEKDRALARRFQKLEICEPSIADTKRILIGLLPHYEKFHGVKYSIDAVNLAVDLSDKYIRDRFLPDKAIDIIDSVGARERIKPLEDRVNLIDMEQIRAEVSKIAKVPVDAEKEDDKLKLKNLESNLKGSVFGQDLAIESLFNAVCISRSGLRKENKTLGAYLFTGPTGSGKTESARQLAEQLSIPLVRFDMSEFQEKHTISRFIGAPAGYVGFGDGAAGDGLLTGAIDKHPHCVLLIDEVEKAHQDVLNIFLQVMDNGSLSNQSGKDINFRNVFLIFTSNLGAVEMEKEAIGFGNPIKEGEDTSAVNRFFSPEFRNRLDAVVPFSKLTLEVMHKILDKFIVELNLLSKVKNVSIVFDTYAKQWLIDKGFDSKMGARPLDRVINEHVKKPISKEILFGKLSQTGGAAIFTVKDDKLVFNMLETPNNTLQLEDMRNELERITA